MIPEWDALIMIQKQMKRLPFVDVQHIKGHQDKHIPYDNLPLLAQLFQREYRRPSPETILPTHLGAALRLSQRTVTAHHITALHSAASGPPLMKYMCRKNNWTDEISASINWEAHGSAIVANRQRNIQCIKMVHDILPTNSNLHRHSPPKQRCSLCNQIEDRDHIIRCYHPSRARWRQEFLKELNGFCIKTLSCPTLVRSFLLNAIQHWFQDDLSNGENLDATNFPDDMRSISEQQKSIGWRQIFNGRFGLAWSIYQERYYSRLEANTRTKVMTGQRWQTNLIKCIWNQWFLLWSMQNQDVHGADEATRRQIEREVVSREIREIHDSKHLMEPSVQALLPSDMYQHLSQSTRLNKNWLHIHGPTMRESMKRAKTWQPGVHDQFAVF